MKSLYVLLEYRLQRVVPVGVWYELHGRSREGEGGERVWFSTGGATVRVNDKHSAILNSDFHALNVVAQGDVASVCILHAFSGVVRPFCVFDEVCCCSCDC